jgi:protein-disulfide isomerase
MRAIVSSMASRADRKEQARAAREAAEAAEARAAARRRNLTILGVIALVAVVVVGGAILLLGGGSKSKNGGGSSGGLAGVKAQVAARFAGLPQHGTVVGDPKAPYTLVEFVDLQCPFCRDYTLNVMPTVLREFVKPGKLNMDMRVRAFLGPDSVTAAKVAGGAAAQSRLWPFADVFYSQQGEENTGYVTPDFLKRITGATPGLNGPRALAFAKTQDATDFVSGNESLASALKSNSTPAFFVRRGGGAYVPLSISSLSPQAFTKALSQAIGQ